MTTAAKLTVEDLHATLEDEDHLGFGYACCHDDLPAGKLRRLDAAIVAVANEEHLSHEDLFKWSNSKYGRWLADAVHGRDATPTRETVRQLLSAAICADLTRY